MGYFIDTDSKRRYFGLVFSCSNDRTCRGRICIVDASTQKALNALPALAIAVVALFFCEVAAVLAPLIASSTFTPHTLTSVHIAVQVGSVSIVIIETLIVVRGWLIAVRANSFCVNRTDLHIDWRHSVPLYLIPVVAFANNVLVMLWVKSLPEYSQPDILSDVVLILAIATSLAGVPRLVWLMRQRRSPYLCWIPGP